MLEALDITEAEAAGLTELAAVELALAKSFAQRAQAETEPEVATDLARSAQRMARSYRQSLMLKVRLKREMAQAARADAEAREAAEPHAARVAERRERLRCEVERLVWDECRELEIEYERCEPIAAALEAKLAELSRLPGFVHEPQEVLVRQVFAALGPMIEDAYDASFDPEPEAQPAETPPPRRDSG